MEEKASSKIKIEIPKSKGPPPDIWEDLESYLFTGFLYSHSIIGEWTYVFKTLNHNEIRLIEFMRPYNKSSEKSRSLFRSSFIAYSIFMINGKNILFDRENHIDKLINVINRIPAKIQNKIVENLSYLNNKSNRLFPLVEIYVHESRSRYKWFQFKNMPINSPSVTGINGSENLGCNYAQLTWSALNRIEDRREEAEKDWSNAKFIGSCFAGKGVRSVDERDKARANTEKQKLEDLKLRVLRDYLNGKGESVPEDMDEIISLPDGRRAKVVSKKSSESAEELAEELSNSLNGQKDEHDLIVERHMEKMRVRAMEIDDNVRQMHVSPSINDNKDDSRIIVIGSEKEARDYVNRMTELKLENLRKIQEKISGNQISDNDG